MKAILAILVIAFLTSCSSSPQLEAPKTKTYSKMNERDNVGEIIDDMQFHWESFVNGFSKDNKNPLDAIFYPFKKDGVRDGLVLWYK